ncbi:hypothetical protein EG329_009164 [Mollisiaceae sp. DMI_Dod_QoI]|nr:hypothetical protein EG329_009164 [Helotiales sp. DMI_Dod_QoI]
MSALRFVRSVLKNFQAESGLEPRYERAFPLFSRVSVKLILRFDITDEAYNSASQPLFFSFWIRVTAAEPGRVDFELDIKKEHTNRLNIMHGGTIASMVDLGGSLAVASRGLYATGVSTDLNVTYLNSGGQVGDVLKAVVKCDKFGKTLAYTSIQFTNSKGEIAARGSHTKYA